MRKRLTDKRAAGSLRREITDDFKYDKKKLKHLHKILHNVNVALGTLGSALGEFSKVKGPQISPDGMLGGLGYVMPLKDIKEAINTSIHTLSDVADSVADELSNPHWQAEDDKETKDLIKEKEKVEEETQEVMENEEAPESQEGTSESEETAPEAQESEAQMMEKQEQLTPEDVKTSKNVITASTIDADKALSNTVKEALVRFSSVGKVSWDPAKEKKWTPEIFKEFERIFDKKTKEGFNRSLAVHEATSFIQSEYDLNHIEIENMLKKNNFKTW